MTSASPPHHTPQNSGFVKPGSPAGGSSREPPKYSSDCVTHVSKSIASPLKRNPVLPTYPKSSRRKKNSAVRTSIQKNTQPRFATTNVNNHEPNCENCDGFC